MAYTSVKISANSSDYQSQMKSAAAQMKVLSAEYTTAARVISFEAFSMMVDEALEKMKKMLESNKAMQELVNGEAGEVGEKAV